ECIDSLWDWVNENIFGGLFWWVWLILFFVVVPVLARLLAKLICKHFFPTTWKRWKAEEQLKQKQADESVALKLKHKEERKNLKE
ncbi:MAG: hypothetical protein LBS50_10910, partial [Prevotellaceae bacterium]|nr:hypothetical protein [Prevotellaceae bacterium]